jgi:hypothetical protein
LGWGVCGSGAAAAEGLPLRFGVFGRRKESKVRCRHRRGCVPRYLGPLGHQPDLLSLVAGDPCRQRAEGRSEKLVRPWVIVEPEQATSEAACGGLAPGRVGRRAPQPAAIAFWYVGLAWVALIMACTAG